MPSQSTAKKWKNYMNLSTLATADADGEKNVKIKNFEI